MKFSVWIMPVSLVLIVLIGIIKKVPVFECFADGAKKGLHIFTSLLPSLTALMLAVSMLDASGGTAVLARIISPIASLVGIPEEVIPLCLLSPISGSGSLSIFENILTACGPDSAAGRIASVISGATETTFYAVTVYFSSVEIKKTGMVIPCALIGDIISFISAAITVRLFL